MPRTISIAEFMDLFEEEHETEISSEQTIDYFNFEEAHGDSEGYAVETGYVIRTVTMPGFKLESRIGYIHPHGLPEEAEYVPALPPVPVSIEIDESEYLVVSAEGVPMDTDAITRAILEEFPTVYRFPINALDVAVVGGPRIREHGEVIVKVSE